MVVAGERGDNRPLSGLLGLSPLGLSRLRGEGQIAPAPTPSSVSEQPSRPRAPSFASAGGVMTGESPPGLRAFRRTPVRYFLWCFWLLCLQHTVRFASGAGWVA